MARTIVLAMSVALTACASQRSTRSPTPSPRVAPTPSPTDLDVRATTLFGVGMDPTAYVKLIREFPNADKPLVEILTAEIRNRPTLVDELRGFAVTHKEGMAAVSVEVLSQSEAAVEENAAVAAAAQRLARAAESDDEDAIAEARFMFFAQLDASGERLLEVASNEAARRAGKQIGADVYARFDDVAADVLFAAESRWRSESASPPPAGFRIVLELAYRRALFEAARVECLPIAREMAMPEVSRRRYGWMKSVGGDSYPKK